MPMELVCSRQLVYICSHFMKNLPAFLIWILLIGMMTIACQSRNSDQNTEDDTDTTSSNGGKKEFEKEAAEYESADRVIWQKPDLVVQQLGDVDGKVVADLGAGTGYFSRRVAYKGAKVIAIDIDPNAIQWMREQLAQYPLELRDRMEIRQAEPNDPKLKSQEVDIVLLVNTYSYIDNRVSYFSKLKQAIRPGGQILIIDFKKKDIDYGRS